MVVSLTFFYPALDPGLISLWKIIREMLHQELHPETVQAQSEVLKLLAVALTWTLPALLARELSRILTF